MWRSIGIALGIDITTLEVIEIDHKRADDSFSGMVATWLRGREPLPCWKSLTMGLKSIQINVLLMGKLLPRS